MIEMRYLAAMPLPCSPRPPSRLPLKRRRSLRPLPASSLRLRSFLPCASLLFAWLTVGLKWINHTQLESMAAERSAAAESAAASSKPLAVILAENKAKKEEAFQDVWKSMKQGTQTR